MPKRITAPDTRLFLDADLQEYGSLPRWEPQSTADQRSRVYVLVFAGRPLDPDVLVRETDLHDRRARAAERARQAERTFEAAAAEVERFFVERNDSDATIPYTDSEESRSVSLAPRANSPLC